MQNKKRNMRNAKKKVVRQQPRKDSTAKRVNYDNARVDKVEKDMERMSESKDKSNDVSWYANNPELLRAAASIPFSPSLGGVVPGNVRYAVPGVLSLMWTPAINPEAGAPLNQAANSVYSFTVHANSRNQSYDASDEMLLILAGAQVFSALALGIRAYGLMKQFSQLNRYTPTAMLEMSGFLASSLQANYGNMWYDLNEMIARTQQIWIPNTMPVIERWFWLNSNIYMDASSAKAQYYMFVPYQFYQYDETTESTGGSLQPVEWKTDLNVKHTWQEYCEIVRGMIDALVNSQDRGIIMGDILKAYGADKLYALSSLPVDYVTVPVYNQEVLTQIENSTRFTSIPKAIVQDPDRDNLLFQHWTDWPQQKLLNGGSSSAPDNFVLNFHQPTIPTPEQIMVATRLRVCGAKIANITGTGTSARYELAPATCGTEVIVAAYVGVIDFNTDASGKLKIMSFPNQVTATGNGFSMAQIYTWTAFDWAPWIFSSQYATNTAEDLVLGYEFTDKPYYMLGDWDMYTFLNIEELKKMNLTAIYSEFGVPVLF